MLIKFIKPDPRAGDVVRLDSSLARRFISEGRAEAVSEAAGAQAATSSGPLSSVETASKPTASRKK